MLNKFLIYTHTRFSSQKDHPIQMHYFPNGGHIDKMYFPYYGKKAHVSICQRMSTNMLTLLYY